MEGLEWGVVELGAVEGIWVDTGREREQRIEELRDLTFAPDYL